MGRRDRARTRWLGSERNDGHRNAHPPAAAEEGAATDAATDTAPAPTPADDSARIETLEEKVEILTEEVGRLESIFAVPEELALESFHGLGPAASKVYKKDGGLSIGGYGEVRLRTFHNTDDDDRDNIYDALRAVLYVGYKFNDNWVMNSELEFEHARHADRAARSASSS